MKNRILGFLPILYGVEYLECCLLSIRDYCDAVHVCHTDTPSHSYKTIEKCPDSLEEIYDICKKTLGHKLLWGPAPQNTEGESLHRNERYRYSKDFHYILSIDADEVFSGITEAIEFAANHEERFYGTRNYLNFWKSFNYVNTDQFAPIRIEKLSAENYLQNHENPLKVFHFSTAQNSNTIRYKNTIFGHASEIRPDWFEDIYMKWTPESGIEWLHPVSLQIWKEAQPFNRHSLPLCLQDHPNFNKSIIE